MDIWSDDPLKKRNSEQNEERKLVSYNTSGHNHLAVWSHFTLQQNEIIIGILLVLHTPNPTKSVIRNWIKKIEQPAQELIASFNH